METQTLDKLYLEWSQFTKAKTAREIELERENERLKGVLIRVFKGEHKSTDIAFCMNIQEQN